MKLRHIGAASALVLGVAVCGAAAAQTATNSGSPGQATASSTTISGLNGNSVASGNDFSNQNNDYSQRNGNAVLSGDTSHSNNTRLDSSQNNNSNQGNDYSNNSAQDNSQNFSLRVNATTQDLSSDVTGVSFNASETTGQDNRSLTTGALSYSGGAYQAFAGIQTATTNTGIAANNLAATSVSANANVSFGGGNGGSQ